MQEITIKNNSQFIRGLTIRVGNSGRILEKFPLFKIYQKINRENKEIKFLVNPWRTKDHQLHYCQQLLNGFIIDSLCQMYWRSRFLILVVLPTSSLMILSLVVIDRCVFRSPVVLILVIADNIFDNIIIVCCWQVVLHHEDEKSDFVTLKDRSLYFFDSICSLNSCYQSLKNRSEKD